MTKEEFDAQLKDIATRTVSELHELVMKAREEEFGSIHGDQPLPWADNWDERELDAIIEAGGFVYDRVNGRNRLSKRSTVTKLRKTLGYTYP